MTLAGKIFRFFVYSNLFIACCATAMVYQTCQLLVHVWPEPWFVSFVFFGTICSYSFHWYLTPADANLDTDRTFWLKSNRKIHWLLFWIGLIGAFISGLFLLEFWIWVLLSALITFLYTAPKLPHPYFRLLRKIALGKTIFLAFVWTYVTTILPLIVSGIDWALSFTVFAASRFFFIYAICILFDYRDREFDKKQGIRSLITALSEKGIKYVFVASLLIFSFLTIIMTRYGFSKSTLIILIVPAAATSALYGYARRHSSDLLYFFILDGLMAVSAIYSLIIGL